MLYITAEGCLNGFWSEAPHNWPANLLGAKANPPVSRTSTNSLPPTLSLAGAFKSLPLFAFSIHRGWRNSVKWGAKPWEASFLLGLGHLVLQRHQIIKKEQFGCQVGGWFLFTGNGMGSHAQSSRRLQRLQKKSSKISVCWLLESQRKNHCYQCHSSSPVNTELPGHWNWDNVFKQSSFSEMWPFPTHRILPSKSGIFFFL